MSSYAAYDMLLELTLFGDFERQVTEDSSVTVSLYETTGSDLTIGTQA